jgi:sigma-B regulation protein RsbU (phosphoserine phosphatase)
MPRDSTGSGFFAAALHVRQVMSPDPVIVPPTEPLQEVIRRMADLRIGAVLVGDRGQLIGIFTERDLLRIAPDAPHGWRQSPVADWMTRDPHTVAPDVGWEDAAALLDRLHVRHLPVVENGKAIGILSSRLLMGHRAGHLNRAVEERTKELQRLTAELIQRERQTERSLKVAGQLMNRLLLPSAPPVGPDLAWAVHFRPLGPLGGDYYDFAQPDGRHLGVLIADASGHSLPAAMVAIMARIAFAEVGQDAIAPATVLRIMNQRLQELTEERFVSAFYGAYDRVTRRFTYAGAGHPPPLHYDARTGVVQSLRSPGLLLGIEPDVVYEEQSIDLRPGDRLCLFTDGITEGRGAGGDLFGLARLNAAMAVPGGHADAVLRRLLSTLSEFRGNVPATDDETLLVAEVR